MRRLQPVQILRVLALFPGEVVGNINDLQPGWMLGGAALSLASACGLAVGLAPAVALPRIELNDVLKTGSRSMVRGAGTRLRSVLVSAQAALALILLLGSGLLLRSFQNILSVDTGFESEGILTVRLDLRPSRYSEESRRAEFGRLVVQRIVYFPESLPSALPMLFP